MKVRTLNTASLTALAMVAFAGNSLLCRLALKNTAIDAASFTSIRLLSAAIMLLLILTVTGKTKRSGGGWLSAFALFAYAAGFSFAYINLTAATGALLLFGAVQISMIGYGLWSGDKFRTLQWLGLAIALGGLLALLLPGLTAPPFTSAMLMIVAGVSWGFYSLRGRGAGDPTVTTSGNFLRALPFGLGLSLLTIPNMRLDSVGILYAVASGAIASGIGYAIWYRALPYLKSSRAAIVQLSVPVIAAIGGALVLGEPLTMRLALASVAVLCGIALVIIERSRVASQ
jgi:drug/metabolite transporter (DMT)-like permease